MIDSIDFKNFKVLRDTTLPLGPFNLIVGPNGSGKSTALLALQAVREGVASNCFEPGGFRRFATVGTPVNGTETVEVLIHWGTPNEGWLTRARWHSNANEGPAHLKSDRPADQMLEKALRTHLAQVRIYTLDAQFIAERGQLEPNIELGESGEKLVGVLDRLRDQAPERFEALNGEIGELLPEFDRILFDMPASGVRTFSLRTRKGHHPLAAPDLSQGTLLALAILTLAHLPVPPTLIGLEEPERGVHPRLLRQLRDALYRLTYPKEYGETRSPVQVLATTHSPYFLDLFKDHAEEIVIAERVGNEARFARLVDRPDIDEVLGDASLGEVWYSGVLGGVPSKP